MWSLILAGGFTTNKEQTLTSHSHAFDALVLKLVFRRSPINEEGYLTLSQKNPRHLVARDVAGGANVHRYSHVAYY